MSLKIGIVGLPNVGKSTLFNALTRSSMAATANFPFCTIDPNKGIVMVPDERLKVLSDMIQPDKVTGAVIEFVDIAGLVKGASVGEGLGNQFLSHIRECDAIALTLRFFEDSGIIHVHNVIDPKADREILEAELILADIGTVEKKLDKARSEAKSGDKLKQKYVTIVEKIYTALAEGKLASEAKLDEKEKLEIKDLHLLTMKPFLYIANVSEEQLKTLTEEILKEKSGLQPSKDLIAVSAKVEADLNTFSEEEAAQYLQELGLKEKALDHLIRAAYKLLGLETFFTAGKKEVRAWTIQKGALAPQAAGVIHTDFEKGFIRAEVTGYNDYVAAGGELKAKEKGLTRQEGKAYQVKDGDVMFFKFNV
ncbi:redox-regulated ATPase YchF [Candidatus Peregrinibacteria bacterium]|nr:redox-regulated ATPase YchF [Candidatus Peregrinibacteria bacterium]